MRTQRVRGILGLVLGAGTLVACGQASTDSAARARQSERIATTNQALASSAAGRPGKIITPVGRIDPACLHEVPDGATVDAVNHKIFNTDGSLLEQYDECPATPDFPQLPHAAIAGSRDGGTPPAQVVNWVEASEANASFIVNSVSGTWTVPPKPTNNGQLLFFFNSIQSASYIVQPVLQYGSNGVIGGDKWIAASWSVVQGNGFHSTPINVNPNDHISGSATLVSCSLGFAYSFAVNFRDTTTGQSTSQTFGTDGDTPFNVEQGALEAYDSNGNPPTTCSDYPNGSNGSIIFQNSTVTQYGGSCTTYSAWSPGWSQTNFGQPVNCNWNVGNFNGGTTLDF